METGSLSLALSLSRVHDVPCKGPQNAYRTLWYLPLCRPSLYPVAQPRGGGGLGERNVSLSVCVLCMSAQRSANNHVAKGPGVVARLSPAGRGKLCRNCLEIGALYATAISSRRSLVVPTGPNWVSRSLSLSLSLPLAVCLSLSLRACVCVCVSCTPLCRAVVGLRTVMYSPAGGWAGRAWRWCWCWCWRWRWR